MFYTHFSLGPSTNSGNVIISLFPNLVTDFPDSMLVSVPDSNSYFNSEPLLRKSEILDITSP